MFTLIAFMVALVVIDVLAVRHGVDSRRDVGRQI